MFWTEIPEPPKFTTEFYPDYHTSLYHTFIRELIRTLDLQIFSHFTMIPIGEVMAEALLESDDSTASLSGTSTEHDSFEGGPTVTPSRLSQVVPFKPRNRQRGDRSKCIKPVSLAKRPQSQSLLSRDLQPSLAMPQYVALDCESKSLSTLFFNGASIASHSSDLQWLESVHMEDFPF